MYIIRWMVVRSIARARAALALFIIAACNPLGRQYEYEEQLYLATDGSATVLLDASLPALAALRGMPLDSDAARLDRSTIRRAFESGGCDVMNVTQPWRRKGRRFIQVRLRIVDVRAENTCKWLGWSTYRLVAEGENLRYQQAVGAPSGGDPGAPAWDRSELVAFKLHLPSRVLDHNVKTLDGSNGSLERGNILTWEQTLEDRLAGKPIEINVVMGAQSILYQTLGLFAGAFVAAVIVLGGIAWWVMKKKRTSGVFRQ
ncbi:MAG TPA: hypothetical protein VES67_06720 [Vicinamibacterales bacterium]|nr:hypothetical protein [Vicinamibacterales bacterium]